MDKEDLKKAMLQAQEMQLSLLKVQDELAKIEISGFSRDKLIQVVMTAQGDTKSVKINANIETLDKLQLERSILEAIQDATQACASLTKEKMSEVSKQIGM